MRGELRIGELFLRRERRQKLVSVLGLLLKPTTDLEA